MGVSLGDSGSWIVDLKMNIRPSSSTGVLFALVYNNIVPLSLAVVTQEDKHAVSSSRLSNTFDHVFTHTSTSTRVYALHCCCPICSRTWKYSWPVSLWQFWTLSCCVTLSGWWRSWRSPPLKSKSQPTPPLLPTSQICCRRPWSASMLQCRTLSVHISVGYQVRQYSKLER